MRSGAPACVSLAATVSNALASAASNANHASPARSSSRLPAPALCQTLRADVMMVTAGRHERGAAAPAHHIEPDHVTVESFRLIDIADPQMHMADAHAVGRAGPGLVAGRGDQIVEVERIGGHLHVVVLPFPFVRPAVAVDLDAVAFGIVEIDRLAHRMVGGAGERHALLRNMQQPARQVAPRRNEERRVIEAGGAGVVRLGGRANVRDAGAARRRRRALRRPCRWSMTASPRASR